MNLCELDWCFWPWISSRIRSQSTDCNSWDTLYVYITIFTDKEKFQKELMKRHEAFLKAMAYYKKKLHIRLRFDEGRLILHFLNIVTPEGNVCSLKLRHTDSKWSCKYYSQMARVVQCQSVGWLSYGLGLQWSCKYYSQTARVVQCQSVGWLSCGLGLQSK